MPWVGVIEAAYKVDGSPRDWLGGVVERLRAVLDDGFGAIGMSYTINAFGTLEVGEVASSGMSPESLRATIEINTRARAAAISGTYLSHIVGTSSAALSPELYEEALAPGFPLGMYDGIGITCSDPTMSGVALVVPQHRKTRVPRRLVAVASRVAAHVAAGARLRRALAAPRNDPWVGAEAILDPRGRFEHAEGTAQPKGARNALRNAAVAIDRARVRRKKSDDFDTVAIWQALVAGRWTVIDHVDSDGRRLFVARKNDPEARPLHRLTARERQVVGYAVLGHSNKLIGYELGLSASTVAAHLAEAASKLGFNSRATLIQAALALGAGD
jgi:DNA-binding CsgD family transcriptional regulator